MAKTLGRALRRFGRNESGAYAVEFGIVFPVLLLMVFGAIELGSIFYDKSRLSHVTASGSRLLLLDPALANSALQTQLQAIANQQFPNGGVTVTVSDTTRNAMQFKQLTATYTHAVLTPASGFGNLNLQTTMFTVAPSVWCPTALQGTQC